MNKFSTVILMLFIAIFAVSAGKKDFPKAEIKASYTYPHLGLKTDGKAYETEYPMILLTNGQYSKFYSPRTEFNDSLHSTPSGRKVYHQLMTEGVRRYVETQDESFIPANHGALYVFKSSQDSTTTVYDSAGMSEFGVYSEPRGGMEWEIGDSTKNILGYECVIATADFRGRSWTVWFTPEIPIDDGPWKLCGLPGLILEASESSGQHRFIADGIEICKKEIHPVYLPKKYSRMSRKELLQAKRAYLLNGDVMTRQLIQNTPSGSRIEMEPINAGIGKDYHVDFLESDYHE